MNQLRISRTKVAMTTALSWVFAIAFSILLACLILSFALTLADSAVIIWRPAFCGFLLLIGIFLLMIGKSVKHLRLMHRLKQIEMTFSHCDRETLFQVAKKTELSPYHLLVDLRRLLSSGYIKNLVVDSDRLLLLVTKDNSTTRILPHVFVHLSEQYTEPSWLPVLPIYSIGLFWISYALLFPLYRWTDFALAGALSFVVFRLARIKWKAPKPHGEKKESMPSAAENSATAVKIDTGNEALDEVLNQMTISMTEVAGIAQQVTNPRIQHQVDILLNVFGEMFNLLKAHPEHLAHVRSFVDYYVPLARKLLTHYMDFSKSASQGGTVLTSMKEIEQGIDVMTDACKKQLDLLYRDKAMDISLDIEIMQNLMNEQGLLSDDEKLKGAAQHGK